MITVKLVTYLIKSWEFEKCLFDGTVVINVDGIFKHVVQEVGVGLDVIVEWLQVFNLSALFLVK